MAPPTPISKAAAFFNKRWTEDIDNYFIDCLMDELLNGHYRVGRDNYSALKTVTRLVHKEFNTNFDVLFCFVRHRMLMLRFTLFNWIVGLSSVTHFPYSNNVKCSDDAWEFICEKDPMARAYIVEGEKKFEALQCLFDDGPINPVPTKTDEVIQISSDHEGNQ